MTKPRTCPRCGVDCTPDAPEGLCPTCLSEVALLEQADPRLGEPDGLRARLEELLPDYELQRFLGRGGMGAVYEARQKKLDRRVALKVLVPAAEADVPWAERFLREARAMARLNHPNIVGVHDFGEVDGLFYLVLEYVEGANLRELFTTGRLEPSEALAIVPQICDALQYAHEEGVVHRDIKPENILLDTRGAVKIADFGLAKLIDPTTPLQTLTGSQQAMGTLRYMAPEQMDAPREVDHRADIYSLGVVFYEMLTGRVPAGNFEPPSEVVQVDVRLDEVVLRALKREPAQRYQRASEITEGLAALKDAPAASALPPDATPAQKSAPTRPRTQSKKSWSAWSTLDLPVFLAALAALMLPGASSGAEPLMKVAPYGWMLIVIFAVPVSVAQRATAPGAPRHLLLPRLLAPFAVAALIVSLGNNEAELIQSTGQLHLSALLVLASVLSLSALARILAEPLREWRRRNTSPEPAKRLRFLALFWCGLGTLGVAMPWSAWPDSALDATHGGGFIGFPDRGYELMTGLAAGTLLAACGVSLLVLRGMELVRLGSAAAVLVGFGVIACVMLQVDKSAELVGPGVIVTGLCALLLIVTQAAAWCLAGGAIAERR